MLRRHGNYPFLLLRRILLLSFLSLLSACILVGIFLFPDPLFQSQYATVVYDREGELAGVMLAPDEQWRFPPADSLPGKFKTALITFEDQRFYKHPGFDPLALVRAFWQNVRAGRIVSGGSTLSMQVIRLAENGKKRSYLQKIKEVILAVSLETRYSKSQILQLYANHAPFGGNIVGLEAASWRYFGRKPAALSWAEASMLAVLPNQPSLIFPGKNQELLLKKRNRLLRQLFHEGLLDALTLRLALSERIPVAAIDYPNDAPHLVFRADKHDYSGKKLMSTLNTALQKKVRTLVSRHHEFLKNNHIYNAAALVVKVETGEVLAYVGNTYFEQNFQNDQFVDIITSPRSTGSILKPVLYASMLHEGLILPHTLVPDIPTVIDGFAPQNFFKTYDGAVPASEALARSLNVPAVRMLKTYGYEKLHFKLRQLGLRTLNQPPDHYGLALILGGAEGTLEDICQLYASLARSLNQYHLPKDKAIRNPDNLPLIFDQQRVGIPDVTAVPIGEILSPGSIWHLFESLKEVERPGVAQAWKQYVHSRQIAWKTGTSFGNRDAWAVGITPEYVVGVWAGNADGEGRAGLTGMSAAGPLMFSIFNALPQTSWFQPPEMEMIELEICDQSGFKAGDACESRTTSWVPHSGIKTGQCPFHFKIFLDASGQYRTNRQCTPREQMKHASWFELPPVQAWYYRKNHPAYAELPPPLPGCIVNQDKVMDIVYPSRNTSIYIPKQLSGQREEIVFEVAHQNPSVRLFWHLDGKLIHVSQDKHVATVLPEVGEHRLLVMDEYGERAECSFKILEK